MAAISLEWLLLLLLLGADLDKFNLVKLKTLTGAADTGVSAANKIGNENGGQFILH